MQYTVVEDTINCDEMFKKILHTIPRSHVTTKTKVSVGMARTMQKLISPSRIAAGQENPLGCGDSNCCRFIKRCSGIRISLMQDEFH